MRDIFLIDLSYAVMISIFTLKRLANKHCKYLISYGLLKHFPQTLFSNVLKELSLYLSPVYTAGLMHYTLCLRAVKQRPFIKSDYFLD